jgi:hypothetical protein
VRATDDAAEILYNSNCSQTFSVIDHLQFLSLTLSGLHNLSKPETQFISSVLFGNNSPGFEQFCRKRLLDEITPDAG